MKKYMVMVKIAYDLDECESDQAAREAADEIINEMMDGYVIDDASLFEVDEDGAIVRGVES